MEHQQRILITGAAGFIGYHLAQRLLEEGREVVGIDNFDEYYSPALKSERVAQLEGRDGFRFVEADLADPGSVAALVQPGTVDAVVHLAAQAGVRYSINNPEAYATSNMMGTYRVLEACRHGEVKHLVYASSSSVYGLNTSRPYAVSNNVDHPVSLYAATKKSGELMAHAYAHLFDLPITGLRFFTVYGPWGRPDMAYFKFARAILLGEKIQLFAGGRLRRDYTYIDDIVTGVVRVIDRPAEPSKNFDPASPDPSISSAPYRLYNIGRGKPFSTREMLASLEEAIGREAIVEEIGMQAGEVEETWASVEALKEDVGYAPQIEFEDGIERFAQWFLDQYQDGGEIPR